VGSESEKHGAAMMPGRELLLLFAAISLTACGGTNQALLASGGSADFAAMNHVSEEYGSGDSDAVVPVMVGDQEYSYRIWLNRPRTKIMVQTGSLAGTAAAGFVRGLTAGIVSGDPEYQPFQDAAISYLTSTYGAGCRLSNSRKITRIGFEWNFECAAPQPPKPPRPAGRRASQMQ
jgi:hypothetical protein